MSSMIPERYRFNPFEHERFPGGKPRIDWREMRAEHVIKADLPGVRRGDVRVEIEYHDAEVRVLVISGDRRRGEEEPGDRWRMLEKTSGRFRRAMRLPEDARDEEATAVMEHGMLTVAVPKAHKAQKPAVRWVKIYGM